MEVQNRQMGEVAPIVRCCTLKLALETTDLRDAGKKHKNTAVILGKSWRRSDCIARPTASGCPRRVAEPDKKQSKKR